MKIIILIMFILVKVNSGMPANPEWLSFSNGEKILALVEDGNFLWIATDGGLVKFNKNTVEKVFFNKANTNNGLMDNHIRSLAIDSSKNLWVGTQYGGISKYDGAAWQNFNPGNSPLPHENVSCISVDKTGKLFIGNGDYLTILAGSLWNSFELGNPLLSYFSFNNIVFDSLNRAWISTSESGDSRLFTFSDNNIIGINNDTIKGINSLAIDKFDNIWCGTEDMGLLKYNGKYFISYKVTNTGVPPKKIKVSFIDPGGNIWCVTDSSVWKFFEGEWLGVKPDIGAGNVIPFNIISDAEELLWIGTMEHGLIRFNGVGWEKFKTSNSPLFNNFPNLIASDDKGSIWVSFLQPADSILSFNGTNWNLIKNNDSYFRSNNFKSLYSTDSLKIWIGNGLVVEFVNTASWAGVYNINNHRHGNHLKIDGEGNLWQASNKNGLWKFDGNIWTNYNYKNTPVNFNSTGSIVFSNTGILYALSSDAGIIKYDGINWQIYPAGFFLSDSVSNALSYLEADKDGNIWLGTRNKWVSDTDFGEGIIKFDGETITRFNFTNSELPNIRIVSLHFDSNDNLWIGSENGDLICFKENSTCKVFNYENSGISRFDISPIEVDDSNNIWFGNWWNGIGVYHEGGVLLSASNNYYVPMQPSSFSLNQNYPNPFNPSTTISFNLTERSEVTITLCNIIGEKLKTIVSGTYDAGEHKIIFDAAGLASGIYFYTLNAGRFNTTKKLVLIR